MGAAIQVEGLTKVYGAQRAVDDLTFTARDGGVTGFLGPNGAGKTTTLRVALGLAVATSGRATIGGRLYRDLPRPIHEVAAVIEGSGFHAGRSARNPPAPGPASALLGDPEVLILDEPANGLDPAGIHWLREFLRSLADQGRTVLVSSHVLAEVAAR